MFSIIISLLSFFTNTQFVFALVCWIQSENAVDLNVLENSTWKIFCNFILVNFNNNNNTFTTTGIKKIIVFFFLIVTKYGSQTSSLFSPCHLVVTLTDGVTINLSNWRLLGSWMHVCLSKDFICSCKKNVLTALYIKPQ